MTKKPTTNPLGPGTRNLSVNVPNKLRNKLETLAVQSNMKLSAYVRQVLEKAVAKEIAYRIEEVTARERKVAEAAPKHQFKPKKREAVPRKTVKGK